MLTLRVGKIWNVVWSNEYAWTQDLVRFGCQAAGSCHKIQAHPLARRRSHRDTDEDDRIVPLETGAGVVETGPNSNMIKVPLTVYGPSEMIKITINP